MRMYTLDDLCRILGMTEKQVKKNTKEFKVPGCLVEINALGYAEQLWVYNADIVDDWVNQKITTN